MPVTQIEGQLNEVERRLLTEACGRFTPLLDHWRLEQHDIREFGLLSARKIKAHPSPASARAAGRHLLKMRCHPVEIAAAVLPSNVCGFVPGRLPSRWAKAAFRRMQMSTAPKGAERPVSLKSKSPSYTHSTGEKLRLFLPCLRQKISPKRNLFAGPFVGEFGFELMQWQAYVRARCRDYEKVHVLTYPQRDYLYEGCQVHYHEIDLKTAGYGYGLLSPAQSRRMAQAKAAEIGLEDYDIFDSSLLCTRYHKILFWRQDFRLFEEPPLAATPYDVVFHFRAVQKEGPDQNKNYTPSLANVLVQLCLERGLSVACIGHPAYSYCPPGCVDHRNLDLRRTVAAISAAHAVAGENSGPMHLANLCGKPTILWAQDQWRIDFSLRWNPFRVPIYIAANNTCQPAPDLVCDAIAAALRDLRLRTRQFTVPAYTLPAQPIAPV